MEQKTKLCPHCIKEVDLMASRCPHCHGKMHVWTVKKKVIAGIFIFVVFLFLFMGGHSQPTTSSIIDNSVNDEPQLELISQHCYEEYGYFQFAGEVKNISGKSLKNVEAVGTAYTKTGEFVNSDDALISYNPILPGQTSSFKVMMTYNPAMQKCATDFKYLMGESINFTKHDSPKTNK